MQIEKEQTWRALKGWQWIRENHGSLYDRGSADSYYGRGPSPHYGGVGGDSGERVSVTDNEGRAEYMAGYNYNERFGDKKDYR
jgi:Tfp pilus assembly protein PilV